MLEVALTSSLGEMLGDAEAERTRRLESEARRLAKDVSIPISELPMPEKLAA